MDEVIGWCSLKRVAQAKVGKTVWIEALFRESLLTYLASCVPALNKL